MFNQLKNYKRAAVGALALFLTTGLLTLTFAFTNGESDQHKSTTYYWFSTDASGQPLAPIATPTCNDPSGDFCARQYADDQLIYDENNEPIGVLPTEVDNPSDFRLIYN